ncbi:SMC-Scp complex subunit ScpB [Amnibacterium endophyticum]|uniref:SMC-Scp complex subunit ScpB n=1 Tax=Amnibacterium endophyticum TaxID=2109337 RepID=A0ABW4LD55_9MICO
MTDDARPARRTPQEPVALLLAGLAAPVEEAVPGLFSPPRRATAAPAEPVLEPGPEPLPVAPPRSPEPGADAALDEALEALFVAADRPLDLLTVASTVERPVGQVRRAVQRIRDDLDGVRGGRRRGFELREVATGWRLYARPAHDAVVRSLLEIETAGRLSQAALETLAVVAYRQPVSRGQIGAIRAVSVDSVLKTLVARGLVEEVGRSEETGATLYGTTEDLLAALGIRSIDELPPLAPLLEDAEDARAVAR